MCRANRLRHGDWKRKGREVTSLKLRNGAPDLSLRRLKLRFKGQNNNCPRKNKIGKAVFSDEGEAARTSHD